MTLPVVEEIYILLPRTGCFANDKFSEVNAFVQKPSLQAGVSESFHFRSSDMKRSFHHGPRPQYVMVCRESIVSSR